LSPLRAFYLTTLGAARVLSLHDRIGSFAPGREADFIVLNPRATPLLARRFEQSPSLSERLLLLMTLGDDRAVAETYILGKKASILRASGPTGAPNDSAQQGVRPRRRLRG
jgi:guanine deaminase